jgi:hypothetical protein
MYPALFGESERTVSAEDVSGRVHVVDRRQYE